eukprot:6427238-Amphidinium_carterae.1
MVRVTGRVSQKLCLDAALGLPNHLCNPGQKYRFGSLVFHTYEGLAKRARSMKSGSRSTDMQKEFCKVWQQHRQGLEQEHILFLSIEGAAGADTPPGKRQKTSPVQYPTPPGEAEPASDLQALLAAKLAAFDPAASGSSAPPLAVEPAAVAVEMEDVQVDDVQEAHMDDPMPVAAEPADPLVLVEPAMDDVQDHVHSEPESEDQTVACATGATHALHISLPPHPLSTHTH